MRRPIQVADLMCGAGGTSTGARLAAQALGVEMELVVVNHWSLAIETHRRMHPEARHHCQDIATLRPIEAVPGGALDLLMASPTCTHHSRARGGKPTSDQQRSDPWHIITWLTELRVRRLLIENVPEYQEWGPVHQVTGRPLESRKGEYFRAWIATLEGLGYRVQYRILNCANYGDATTRQRFFLQARNDGRRIVWPAPTHSRDGKPDLFGAGGRRWRPAREIIDWSIKGRSIFRRPKPLSSRTLQRIYAGAIKLGWPQPYIVVLRNHMTAQGIDLPLPAITAGGTHIGLVEPAILPQPSCGALRPVSEPVSTIATGGAHALVTPYYGSGSGESGISVAEPLPTVTTKARFGLAQPILLPQRSDRDPSRTAEDPLPTITTVTHGGGPTRSHDVEQPLPTLTCANRGELAFVVPGFGEREGQAPRLHSVDDPMPTICAQGHAHLAEPGPAYDILFRMLEPEELAAAMSFDALGTRYDFAGTKADKTKQIGNAVPVRTAQALVTALLHDLTAKPAPADAGRAA